MLLAVGDVGREDCTLRIGRDLAFLCPSLCAANAASDKFRVEGDWGGVIISIAPFVPDGDEAAGVSFCGFLPNLDSKLSLVL